MVRVWFYTVQRNAGSYLAEWLAFHRATGVERFLVVDDKSDDGTAEWLAVLAASVDWLEVRDVEPYAKTAAVGWGELAVQNRCFEAGAKWALEGGADWCAGIDIDEFLLPRTALLLTDILGRMPARLGAVPVCWRMVGSGGQEERGEAPVIERFTDTRGNNRRMHSYFKTLARPAAVLGYPNAHSVILREGYQWRWPGMGGVQFQRPARPVRVAAPVMKDLVLHHFRNKSREEFLEKERLGTLATGIGARWRRPRPNYWKNGQGAGVANRELWRYLEETKRGMREIEGIAGKFGGRAG